MKKKINSSTRIEKITLNKNLKKNNNNNNNINNNKNFASSGSIKLNDKNKKFHVEYKNLNYNTQKTQPQKKEKYPSSSCKKHPKRLCQEKNEQGTQKNKIESQIFGQYKKNNKKLNASLSVKKNIKDPKSKSRSNSKLKSKHENISDEIFNLDSIQLNKNNNNFNTTNINDKENNNNNHSSKNLINDNNKNISNNQKINNKTNTAPLIKKNITIKITKKSNIQTTKINSINNKPHLKESKKSSSDSFTECKNPFSLPENFEAVISDKFNYDVNYETLEIKAKNQSSTNRLKTSEFWINYCEYLIQKKILINKDQFLKIINTAFTFLDYDNCGLLITYYLVKIRNFCHIFTVEGFLEIKDEAYINLLSEPTKNFINNKKNLIEDVKLSTIFVKKKRKTFNNKNNRIILNDDFKKEYESIVEEIAKILTPDLNRGNNNNKKRNGYRKTLSNFTPNIKNMFK